MDELNLIAAVMAAGVAPALREQGQSNKVAAEKAVEMFLTIRQALTQIQLPTHETMQRE